MILSHGVCTTWAQWRMQDERHKQVDCMAGPQLSEWTTEVQYGKPWFQQIQGGQMSCPPLGMAQGSQPAVRKAHKLRVA